MTMNCPVCGVMMVWINGSISHDPPVKYYICRSCSINVTKNFDNTYEISPQKQKLEKESR